ncbi:conserved hypothetical cytosolic protein [Desulfonatronospira thiodismutans ASO3-1]|uniref:Conserved hypothetical cytosolic protein n=1 Tax=Desulfonatronospira thiodismutans ASO3-1 TaxID=555779 RepID=D6SS89_9BACT|nr:MULTISPECIES: hypothetical protein [Desulfonatronospira]EFI33555.1 conserved hypothetical cytosolic protein [Desulfonatronospira thiodismutans ASO3-1]RQD73462.1 MAG: cytotoxic translational repressor of toxin-antitoxin stability system [Desulfonatronospira sp. MSAO_Bac3]
MAWSVRVKKKAVKKARELPRTAKENLFALMREMEESGPVRGNWKNYSKLGKNRHHCHIKGGHPAYVAVWEESEGEINLIEVTYAGTHEDAPY